MTVLEENKTSHSVVDERKILNRLTGKKMSMAPSPHVSST
jgi:hypothetical protein